MWLMLCESDDHSALWASHGLRARGLEPLEIVTPQALVYGLRWDHRLGVRDTHVAIRLHDARVIDSARTRGVINRLGYLPVSLFAQACDTDRLYAQGEMTALFMSWLAAMPAPVLNRPTAQGLCGAWRHASEWMMLAAEAGLSTRPYHQNGKSNPPSTSAFAAAGAAAPPALADSRKTRALVLVVGSRVVAPHAIDLPSPIADGCARLARLAGQGLLGIDLTREVDGRWLFNDASPRPDLRAGGAALLDALAEAMRDGAPREREEAS
jgi:hypothetical protein